MLITSEQTHKFIFSDSIRLKTYICIWFSISCQQISVNVPHGYRLMMGELTLSLPESSRRADRSGSRQSNSASAWLWFSGTTGISGIFTGDLQQMWMNETASQWGLCNGSQLSSSCDYQQCTKFSQIDRSWLHFSLTEARRNRQPASHQHIQVNKDMFSGYLVINPSRMDATNWGRDYH